MVEFPFADELVSLAIEPRLVGRVARGLRIEHRRSLDPHGFGAGDLLQRDRIGTLEPIRDHDRPLQPWARVGAVAAEDVGRVLPSFPDDQPGIAQSPLRISDPLVRVGRPVEGHEQPPGIFVG
jgi:hypothetical protein